MYVDKAILCPNLPVLSPYPTLLLMPLIYVIFINNNNNGLFDRVTNNIE